MSSAAERQAGSHISTVAVIGAGKAGRSFALAAANAGFSVFLEDVMPANLRLAREQYDLLPPEANRGALQLASTIEAAVRDADIAVDFVPDELESKLEIFCLVDRMAPPRTIVLTPSEALSITDLASCTYRPDRCFAVRGDIAHTGNGTPLRILHPPSFQTASLTAVCQLLTSMGSVVVTELDRDAPMLVR